MIAVQNDEYYRLLANSLKLEALESAGVDNWDWYYEALNNFSDNFIEDLEPRVLNDYLEKHKKDIEELTFKDYAIIITKAPK